MREREGGQRFLIHALKEKKKKRSLLFFFPIFRPLPPSIRLVFFKMYVMRLWLSLLVLSLSSGRFFFLRRVILCVCVFLFYFASLSSSLFSIPFCNPLRNFVNWVPCVWKFQKFFLPKK